MLGLPPGGHNKYRNPSMLPSTTISRHRPRSLEPLNIEWKNDTYVPSPFVNTREIIKMHDAPRFGNTNNISVLLTIDHNDEQSESYVIGIFVCSILIFALFAIWTLVLFTLRAVGKKRAGFWSGSMPIRPPPPPLPSSCKQDLERADEIEVRMNEEDDVDEVLVNGSLVVCPGADSSPSTGDEVDGIIDDQAAPVEESAPYISTDDADNTSPTSDEVDGAIADQVASEDETNGSLYPAGISSPKSDIDDDNEDDIADRIADQAARVEESEQCISIQSAQSNESEDYQGNGSMLPTDYEEERTDAAYLEYKAELAKYDTRLFRTRVAVILFGLVALISSALMMRKGLYSLIGSLNDIGKSLDQGASVINGLLNITEEFLLAQNSSLNALDDFLQHTPDDWCPNATIPENVANATQIEKAQEYLQRAIDIFKPAYKQLLNDLVRLREDLKEILKIEENLGQVVGQFKWAHYAAAAFVIILDVLILATMISVGLAWAKKLKKPFRWLHSAFFYTIFLLTLFLMWLFTCIFVLGSIVGADFCYNSPDRNVLLVMHLFELDKRLSPFTYGMLTYYVSGCEDSIYPAELDKYTAAAVSSLAALHKFTTEIAAIPLLELVLYCGKQSATLVILANIFDEQMHVIINSLLRLRELLFCENIHPIYAGVAHDAICYSGVRGLTWLFSTQLAVAISCMTIVTLRAAWDDEERVEKENGNYVRFWN